MRWRGLAAGMLVASLVATCGSDGEITATSPAPAATSSPDPEVAVPTPESRPAPTPTPTAAATPPPEPTAEVTSEPPESTPEPRYSSSVAELDDGVRAAIEPTSWRPGCPVALDELHLVTVSHWNYVGEVATGELIVHRDHANGIAQVFGELFAARFPVERIELVDRYGGDDVASMQANNTSAFNCREVAYSPGVWSNHAFGTAIDVNPLVNPYVDGGFVDPPEGAPYLDRTVDAPGLIRPGDVVVEAFAAIGWSWGGDWTGAVDYQHFSADGR